MSDDVEGSAEAQWEIPDKSEMGAASTMVVPDRDAERLATAFVWVMRYDIRLAAAGSLLLAGLVLVFDVHVPCPLQIIGLTAGLSAVVAGRWVNRQIVDLMGDPQMMWLADVDLLDCDGAGVCTCSTPRWSGWTIADGRPRWATPNLAFGRDVDLDAREVAGTWVDSLPGPVLTQVLEYLRYSRRQLEPKVREGELLEIDSFTIVQAAAVRTMKHIVWTSEEDVLPNDGDMLHVEIDSAFRDFDLDGLDSIFDEDPTEWAPGDGDPTPDPLADLDQRRKQHVANDESE